MSAVSAVRRRAIAISAPSTAGWVTLAAAAGALLLGAVVGAGRFEILAGVLAAVAAIALIARGPAPIFFLWLAFSPILQAWQGVKLSQNAPSITFDRGMIFLLILAGVVSLARTDKSPVVRLHPTDVFFALAAAVRVASVLARPANLNDELLSAYTAFGVPLAAYIATRSLVHDRRRLNLTLWTFAFIAVYLVAGAFYEEIRQVPIYPDRLAGWANGVFRAGSFAGPPWSLEVNLLIILPFLLYLQSEARNTLTGWLHRIVQVAAYAGVFFSYVRAGWIGVALQVVIRIFTYRTDRKRLLLALAVALLLLGLSLQTIEASQAFQQRVASLQNLQGRTELDEAQLSLFQASPIIGYGGGLGRVVTQAADPTHVSHNTFLVIAVELGLVGLLPYAAGLAAALLTARRIYVTSTADSSARRLTAAVAMAAVGYLTCANASDLTYFPVALSLMSVALAIGISADKITAAE
jgi:O-antigen ligase